MNKTILKDVPPFTSQPELVCNTHFSVDDESSIDILWLKINSYI